MIHDSLIIFDWQPLRCPPVKSVSVALRQCVGQPRTRGSWSDWRLRWQKCAVRCQTWKGSWKLAVEPVESPLRKPRSTSRAPPWTLRWDPAANPVNCSSKRPFRQDTLAVVCTELFFFFKGLFLAFWESEHWDQVRTLSWNSDSGRPKHKLSECCPWGCRFHQQWASYSSYIYE